MQCSTSGTGRDSMSCSRTLHRGGNLPVRGWREHVSPGLLCLDCRLCGGVCSLVCGRCSVFFIYNLLFPSFLIKLPKFCVSPAAACRPRGVLQWLNVPREPGITLWPLSWKTGQSLRRDPRKKDRCSKDIAVWEKLNVITEKKMPKSQTSVGNLKTSHNGN